MLLVVALLPVADLLVDLLVVVLVAAGHLGVLPVVLVVRVLVGLLVGLLVAPEVLAVSGVAVAALMVVEQVGLLPTCFHYWVRVSQRVLGPVELESPVRSQCFLSGCLRLLMQFDGLRY